MPYRSVFDGYSLTLYRSDGSIVGSWPAISGKSGRQRPSEQNLPFNGPLTEGEYSFSTRDIQPMTTYDAAVGLIPGKHGPFPHSIPAWGTERVALVPKSTPTNGRNNFFIHGGLTPGSAGCIDLGPNEKAYFDALRSTGEPSHKVIVSYDPSLETSPHPLAERYVWNGVGDYLTRPLPSPVVPSPEKGALPATPAFRPDAVYSPDGYFIGNFPQTSGGVSPDVSSPDRQQSFADRFGRWGSSPAGVAPVPAPDSPASFDNRFGNWGSAPVGGSGETHSPGLRELQKHGRSAAPDDPTRASRPVSEFNALGQGVARLLYGPDRLVGNSSVAPAAAVSPAATTAAGPTAPVLPNAESAFSGRSENASGGPRPDNNFRRLSRWDSSALPGVTPPPPMPAPEPGPPLGIVSGKSMSQWPLPPQVFGLPDTSNASGNSDWFDFLAGMGSLNSMSPAPAPDGSKPVRYLSRRVVDPSRAPAADSREPAPPLAPSDSPNYVGGLAGRIAALAGIDLQHPTQFAPPPLDDGRRGFYRDDPQQPWFVQGWRQIGSTSVVSVVAGTERRLSERN